MSQAALNELARRRRLADGAERQERISRQHERGGLTGRERIDRLLDPGSYLPMGRLVHSEELADADRSLGGDGAIHGFGTIDERPVAVFASDPTIKGATGSSTVYRVTHAHERFAARFGLPVFDLHQSGGARITDLMTSKFAGIDGANMGERHVFPRRNLFFCGILGDYWPPWNMVQSDFTVMSQTAHGALTSPALLEVATGQQTTADELGGAKVHGTLTGQVDRVAPDEPAAIEMLRKVFSYLPSRPGGTIPRCHTGDPPDRIDLELRDFLPDNPRRAYDMTKLVERVCDVGTFVEWMPGYARNLVCGIARLNGQSVAVMANQPRFLAGTLDVKALRKARRMLELVHTCELPLISFIDTPGVLTTQEQEHERLITEVYRTSMERLRPHVPKVAVVVRKGIGFAYIVMSAGDPEGITFAWPSARIAFTGPEPAARIVHHRSIANADDPAAELETRAEEMRRRMEPSAGEALAYLDEVIDPAHTRPRIIRAIEALRGRRP
ncbi:hypothetical protein MK489_17295 [Myxococcota bacterium]|nr:hypothetical protein [Myxococcota bacterium]